MIDIKNVSKWYGEFKVLTDCTTKVEKGEVVVVCGPSGSGKSTLIKCVNGLEPFQQGEILVDGISVGAAGTDLPKLRSRIGMVFQNFELFPHLSVTERCGKSSKFWNTMPMRERSLGRSVFGSPTEMPSTVISPFWNGSRALTHLMIVDLPLPEGPQTTTTSPFFTSAEQSVSTWNVPYHLLMFLIEIMGLLT